MSPNSQKELLIFVTARIIGDNEQGAVAYSSGIITSPPRPFKLELKDVKFKPEESPVKR